MPAPELWKIPDEFLNAIGMVSVRWNLLETYINDLLIHLLGKSTTENRTHIVFTHMSFPQKLDVLGALLEETRNNDEFTAAQKSRRTLLPLLKEAQTGRNQIVHSVWGMTGNQVTKISISARGIFKFRWTGARIEDIQVVIDTIAKATEAVFELVHPAMSADVQRHKEGKI